MNTSTSEAEDLVAELITFTGSFGAFDGLRQKWHDAGSRWRSRISDFRSSMTCQFVFHRKYANHNAQRPRIRRQFESKDRRMQIGIPGTVRRRAQDRDENHRCEPEILNVVAGEIQQAIDDELTIYLLAIEDITGDGTYDGTVGPGVVEVDADTYSFDSTGLSSDIEVTLAGLDFTTVESGTDITLSFTGIMGDVSVDIPLTQAVITGTFNTNDRCSVGEQVTIAPPTEWLQGGTISGLLTVEDARVTTVVYMGISISLCSFVAYGFDPLSWMLDPFCDADVDTWPNPPDEVTVDGLEAWYSSVGYAATAIYLM